MGIPRIFPLLWPLVLVTEVLPAQIVIDFRVNKISGAPGEINIRTPVTIRVVNVNPLLYEYAVNLRGTARPIDAFSSISQLVPFETFKLEGEDRVCGPAVRTAAAAAQKLQRALPQKNDGRYESLSLEDFRTRWRNANPAAYFAAVAALVKVRLECPGLAAVDRALQAYRRDEARLKRIDSQIDTAATEITTTGSLEPNNDYTITVTESWREPDTGLPVETRLSPQVHTFSPKTSVFTLSAGFLATQVEARRYVRRAVPGAADNDPVRNVLAVEGANRLRPTGAALLNFQIPNLSSETAGLAFSAGPTVRIGAANETSNFGVFAGPTLHLWRTVYLSVGWHLSEFADFPTGFFPGRTIPSSFQGELQPEKRWTARFGFAITFRAKDFTSISKGKAAGGAAQTPASAKGLDQNEKPREIDPDNPPPVPPPME